MKGQRWTGPICGVLVALLFALAVHAQRGYRPGTASTGRLSLRISESARSADALSPVTSELREDGSLRLGIPSHPGDLFVVVLATRKGEKEPRWLFFATWSVNPEKKGKPAEYVIQLLRAKPGDRLWLWTASPRQMLTGLRGRAL